MIILALAVALVTVSVWQWRTAQTVEDLQTQQAAIRLEAQVTEVAIFQENLTNTAVAAQQTTPVTSTTIQEPAQPIQPANPTNTPDRPIVYAQVTISIYSVPSINSQIIGRVLPGFFLEIKGINGDGRWYLVDLGDQTYGWIPASEVFVGTAGNLGDVPIVTVTHIPTLLPINTLTATVPLTLTPTHTAISTSTPLPTSTVTATAPPTPTFVHTYTPVATATASGIVEAEAGVNLREGPGTGFDIIYRVLPDTEMGVLDAQVNEDNELWYQVVLVVDEEGELTGWVWARLVGTDFEIITGTITPTPANIAVSGAVASGTAAAYGMTIDADVYLHEGPGVEFEVVKKLSPRTEIRVLDAQVNHHHTLWYQVAYSVEGTTEVIGWAWSGVVETDFEVDAGLRMPAPANANGPVAKPPGSVSNSPTPRFPAPPK